MKPLVCVCPSMCLSGCLVWSAVFVSLSLCLSICLSVCLAACLPACLSRHVCLYVHLSIHGSLGLSVSLSVTQSLRRTASASANPFSLCLPVHMPVTLSPCPASRPSASLPGCLSASVSVFWSLGHSLATACCIIKPATCPTLLRHDLPLQALAGQRWLTCLARAPLLRQWRRNGLAQTWHTLPNMMAKIVSEAICPPSPADSLPFPQQRLCICNCAE